ncbi:MAG: formylglycine-generating enzyme family protein [Candidatus Xenobia bacterium]
MSRIPAGIFMMGSPPGEGNEDERPEHTLDLPEYWMDAEEVTFAQFQAFVKATGYHAKGDWQSYYHPESDTLPVMNVMWEDANAYCRWVGPQLGAGWTARLPSEAEWEKAARGTDGRRYPWGQYWQDGHCNSAEAPLHELMLDVSGHRGPTPVGSWPAGQSPYGLDDCAGNVWEWTRSRYRPYPYRASDGREDGTDGAHRVLRGGSFGEARCCMRCAYRHVVPTDERKYTNYGFRCAFYHPDR